MVKYLKNSYLKVHKFTVNRVSFAKKVHTKLKPSTPLPFLTKLETTLW